MPVRVLIVDDHRIVRQGLQMLLAQDDELEVVGDATNGLEAVQKAHLLKPDVVLMDLLMPVMDGLKATAVIRQELPQVEVLALTSVLEDVSVVEAVRVGAIGYLLKDTEAADLCQAIKGAAAHQLQLSSKAVSRLTTELREPTQPVKDLTQRELQILQLLIQGQSNKQIADSCNLRESTVKSHVSNILIKLGVQSRSQAIAQAIKLGLVSSR